MRFLLERVQKITEELREQIHREEVRIEFFSWKEGHYHSVREVDQSPLPWREFGPGGFWGGRDQFCWFRATLTIPESFAGKTAAIQVLTSEAKGLWDATNPQFILFINGQLIQSLDVNHQEAVFVKRAKAGSSYQIDLQAYSGMLDRRANLRSSIVTVDDAIRDFYYNLNVPLLVAKELNPADRRREILLSVLNETVNRLDLRKPYSGSFYDSLKEADGYLTEHLYREFGGVGDEVATCIGHTHIDVAWLWTLSQTREKAARSFATVLKLMDDYPEYFFMSSQPQLYQFVKEDYPELYGKIKERVRQGRWEPEGAMWVEADCNLASGEALVRQILFGSRFFEKEFGVKSKVLWLPDVFGYSAALPQIMKKSGIDYFMTTKISWNEFNKMPYDTFMWRGIDGTEVLTHFITTRDPEFKLNPHCTTYNGKINPAEIIGGWERYQQKNLNHDILVAFGYGDGGGGATSEMLENARRMNLGIPGCPKTQLGKVRDYFERLEAKTAHRKELPKWSGELYLEYHRGTYTSMGRNKRYNRKSEFLYQDIEFFSVCGMLLGESYPQETINRGWETILLNQFHDILPGSAIEEVYEDSRRQYEDILARGQELVSGALAGIAAHIQVQSPAVIVFNTLSYLRDDIALLNIPEAAAEDYSCLIDSAGRKTPLQHVKENGQERLLIMAAEVPPNGYRTYYLSREQPDDRPELSISDSCLENRYFRVEIDQKGTIASFYDKINRRQVLKPGWRGNVLQAFEDKPAEFNNWNIDLYFQEKMWEVDQVEEISVIEPGPVRGGIRIRKKFLDSTIEQKIYMYANIPRIDFDTRIDWKESQILLKAAFPVDIHTEKATYDIQFGNVERPTHNNTSWDLAQFEVAAHKWADLSETGYGVSLLNDCKYGHDIKDGVMRLTLLKSGIDPNPQADREEHHFLYSLYPHSGDWKVGKTEPMAYSLNVPLYAGFEKPHPGNLPEDMAFFRVDQANVVLTTVKKAEEDQDVILRIYESQNRRAQVKISCFSKLRQVVECNLMEDPQQDRVIQDDGFQFEILPYEIKTFKLAFRPE